MKIQDQLVFDVFFPFRKGSIAYESIATNLENHLKRDSLICVLKESKKKKKGERNT